jgi:hypothetical protein
VAIRGYVDSSTGMWDWNYQVGAIGEDGKLCCKFDTGYPSAWAPIVPPAGHPPQWSPTGH